MSFENKVVVISGAAKGIGAACVDVFRKAEAKLVLLDIDFNKLQEDEINTLRFHCDVASEQQVKTSMQMAYEKFGSIDFLINNAGVQRYGTVTETSEEEWDEVMNINVKGLFLCAKHAIPAMLKKGKGVIINIASVQAFLSQQNVAAYTTAKSAILGLTRSIAVDYAPQVRCLAVCPGTIDTPMFRDSISLASDPGTMMQECIDMHLLKRIGKPEEVAQLVAFLCGDKAEFMTGQTIRIDGGLGITIPGSKK